MNSKAATSVLYGRAISPGLAEGSAYIHQDLIPSLDVSVVIDKKDVEKEVDHLESSTAMITEDLLTLATRVEDEIDSRLATVFETHQMILNDPALKEELKVEIRENLVSASSAVKAVFLRWEKRFLLMESEMARQKGDDMRDISKRLSNSLAGIRIHPLERMPAGSVLVAKRLLPSEIIFLSRNATAAVLLAYGSTGSHAALFAREIGLPCIAKIPMIRKKIPADSWVLVDANLGEVTIDPQAKHKAAFKRKVVAMGKTYATAKARAAEPAVTQDGVTIAVYANVGNREDTERAMENGAEGIGLYRTERAYLGRTTPPDVDELLAEMRRTLEPAKGKPVSVRLLDVGADKPLPFIGFPAEPNPALGRRGIRVLCEYPQVLKTQLSAILQLSTEFDVRILVPMVVLPEDLATVKTCLALLGAELGIAPLPPLGAMIETPAAALSVRTLLPHVSFLSCGTNDLAQYAFAADRDNAAVEQYFWDSSDVIFRLIGIAHDDAPDMPLSVCGEVAGRPVHIAKLLQCGVRALSVAPPLIATIKEAIRAASCT